MNLGKIASTAGKMVGDFANRETGKSSSSDESKLGEGIRRVGQKIRKRRQAKGKPKTAAAKY